jgi:hypothetical protein
MRCEAHPIWTAVARFGAGDPGLATAARLLLSRKTKHRGVGFAPRCFAGEDTLSIAGLSGLVAVLRSLQGKIDIQQSMTQVRRQGLRVGHVGCRAGGGGLLLNI